MKSPLHEVRQFLLRNVSVSALVEGRIYTGSSTQGAVYPKIVIEGAGREQEHHATAAVDRVEANFELNVYDRDEDRAAILAKLVRNAMNGSPGNFGELVVDHCRIDSEREEELPPADGSDDPIYNVEQDWTIWYQEAVPTF